jgi:hypothetical protein
MGLRRAGKTGEQVLMVVVVAVAPVAVDARCRSLVISVNGRFTAPAARDTPVALRPFPDPDPTPTSAEVTGRQFVATVQFYPGGVTKDGEEDCSAQPRTVTLVVRASGAERDVVRLVFPADFRHAGGTVWHSRKIVRVAPRPASNGE